MGQVGGTDERTSADATEAEGGWGCTGGTPSLSADVLGVIAPKLAIAFCEQLRGNVIVEDNSTLCISCAFCLSLASFVSGRSLPAPLFLREGFSCVFLFV